MISFFCTANLHHPIFLCIFAPKIKIAEMKRHILLFIALIFSILTTFAQRTPQQMATVLQQMDERLDKYDYEVQLD